MRNPFSTQAKVMIPLLPLVLTLLLSACGGPPMKPGQGPGLGPPKPPAPPGFSTSKPPLGQAKPPVPSPSASKPAPTVANEPKPSVPGAGPIPNHSAGLQGNAGKLPGPPTNAAPGKPSLPPLPNPLPNDISSPVSKVEQAGNPVDLASDILAAGTNPFLSKLPKPKVPVITDPGAEPAEVVKVDPFENLTLQGVLYGKHPLALVDVAGSTEGGQLVRPGDFVGQARVVAIRIDSIEVVDASGKERKVLSLPSIIGYSATAGASSAATGSRSSEVDGAGSGGGDHAPGPGSDKGHGETQKSHSKGKPSHANDDGNTSLSNIRKISKGAPDPQLQEP